jgi:hypothetical protein
MKTMEGTTTENASFWGEVKFVFLYPSYRVDNARSWK